VNPQVERTPHAWQQIADHYRGSIAAGELVDGAKLPGEKVLAEEWKVAPGTVRRALAQLASEGLIHRAGRAGTFVSAHEHTSHAPRDRYYAAKRTGRIYPPSERAEVLASELMPAPAEVADALGVEPGANVVRRRRVTHHSDLPVAVSTSWLPGDLAEAAPALLSTDRILGGTIGLVREATGREVTSGRDQVSARAATDDEAESLGVPPGSPVLYARTWWFDANGGAIEYGESVSPPGRALTYEYA